MGRADRSAVPGGLGRARRRLGLDRNTLRRGVDRVQWTAAAMLMTIFLAVGPAATFLVAGSVYTEGVRAEREEARTRHEVVATVLGPGDRDDRYAGQTVQARWRLGEGPPRTGTIPAWHGARAGDTRRIWIDGDGELTLRPRPRSRTVADTAYTAVGVLMVTALPPALLYTLIRRRCDRHRYARWDAEWAVLSTRRIP